jgi:hypothetical protein
MCSPTSKKQTANDRYLNLERYADDVGQGGNFILSYFIHSFFVSLINNVIMACTCIALSWGAHEKSEWACRADLNVLSTYRCTCQPSNDAANECFLNLE